MLYQQSTALTAAWHNKQSVIFVKKKLQIKRSEQDVEFGVAELSPDIRTRQSLCFGSKS